MVDPVSRNEVSEMAKLISMMNSGVTPSANEDISFYGGGYSAPVESSPAVDFNPDVAAMKNILEAFNSAQSPTGRLKERAVVDRELREALITETTDRGTRIGSWEIATNEYSNAPKSFDVLNVHTGEPIAMELSLYDAAIGITRLLNEGAGINNIKIREILAAEAEYARARQNAAEFQQRVKMAEHADNYARKSLMEARFDDAMTRAKTARNRVMKIVK